MNIQEPKYAWARPLTVRRQTCRIILHHAAADGVSAQDIHRQHRANGWAGIGYHYYVRKNGEVFRGCPEEMTGTHAAYHNSDSIGVCFEGNFQQEVMSQAQFDAGVELLRDILFRYPELEIICHRDVNQTACPGRNFPAEQMKEESTMANLTQEEFNEMAHRWLAHLSALPPSDWSAEARAWAEGAGIIRGDGDGEYQYKRPMTREEYVAMEYRRQGVKA